MSDVQQNGLKFFIRYQLDRVDFALTEDEFTRLENGAQNIYKDFFFSTMCIAIPCLINSTGYYKKPFEWSWALFLNFFIGLVCLLGAIVVFVVWRKTAGEFIALIKRIKNRPKIEVQVIPSSGTSASSVVESQEKVGSNA